MFPRSERVMLIAIYILGCLLAQPSGGNCSAAMKRLYEDLFTDYNRLILPVANNKTKVTVTLGLKLGQILDLNLKQQILSTNLWVEQTWHDHKLEWQPELYEGIDMIHVPAENIWIPDIVLFNNADGNYELTLVAKATLYCNGTVVWKPPTMFRSTCEIDVEYFPFDIQTCFLRFGSWTYAGDELELRHVGNKRKVEIGIDLSQFYKNVEWDIIDVPAYYNENYYECCSEPYPDITFKIVIRRKMLFYLVNLILPVALMTFMTVSVFYLPSDSNEKVTLSISILTSLIVFFLLMLEIIPASSLAVPLFGKYLLFTLVLVSLSACVSVYVLNLHHRSPAVHAMSPYVRQIFLKTLPRLLRLDQPDPREKSSLNRFRKKKIAQQMLNASANNKVYDLAQPMAASLNLIDTLASSHNLVQPSDDDTQPDKKGRGGIRKSLENDDEGRYFRRYVDDFIERLKRTRGIETTNPNGPIHSVPAKLGAQSNSSDSALRCGQRNNCCSRANQPLHNNEQQANLIMRQHRLQNQQRILPTSCCGEATMDWTESNGDLLCPLLVSSNTAHTMDSNRTTHTSFDHSRAGYLANSPNNSNRSSSYGNRTGAMCKSNSFGCTARRSYLGPQHDDTLDTTLDYDDHQERTGGAGEVTKINGSAKTLRQSTSSGSKQDYSGCCSGNFNGGRHSANMHELDLPSPPPPPRELAHLSCDSLGACEKVGGVSSKTGTLAGLSSPAMKSSSSAVCGLNRNVIPTGSGDGGGKLVDKLLSSIHLINNASDDIDTTTATTTTAATTTSNNEPLDRFNQDPDDDDDDYRDLGDDEEEEEQAVGLGISGNFVNSNRDHQDALDLRMTSLPYIQASHPGHQQAPQQCACGAMNTGNFQLGGNKCTLSSHSQVIANAKRDTMKENTNATGYNMSAPHLQQQQRNLPNGNKHVDPTKFSQDVLTGTSSARLSAHSGWNEPSDLLMSLRLPYDQMPAHVRAAIRSILFVADTIKNEDDENSAIEDWESMSMVVDRLFLWIFFILCTFGSLIILAMAPSLYDQRASIDDKLRIDIPPSNCSASVYAHS